jgi:hypothetical protein
MNALRNYLIGSSLVGWAAGSIHGTLVHRDRSDLIIMSGLQGMVMGPYAPIIIPYLIVSVSKCPIFRK